MVDILQGQLLMPNIDKKSVTLVVSKKAYEKLKDAPEYKVITFKVKKYIRKIYSIIK